MLKKKRLSEEKIQLSAETRIKVRFNETDALGIVWHGHYITYFEDAREAFGQKYGISYLQVKAADFATPIVKMNTEYLLPLRYGETAVATATFVDSPAAKMIFDYQIRNEQGQLVCKGSSVQVFVDLTGELFLNLPPFFVDWKKKMGLL